MMLRHCIVWMTCSLESCRAPDPGEFTGDQSRLLVKIDYRLRDVLLFHLPVFIRFFFRAPRIWHFCHSVTL